MARNATSADKEDTEAAAKDTATGKTEATKAEKPDGRKRRWRDHKIARREELVDGTLAAIRLRGREIGMDEIASEIGISKTVLYRYFTDKADLTNATMTRYVETVATDPEVYLYVMANNAGSNRDVVAESERMIAELLATVLGERLRQREMDSGGSVPFAFAIVGAVQLATHWWISNKSMSMEDLIDYLSMMTWGGIHGVAMADGSPSKFNAQPHPLVTPKDQEDQRSV